MHIRRRISFECNICYYNQLSCSSIAGIRCINPDPTYNFQVRLVNGSNAAEGRVEVLYDRTWGSICEDEWSIEDARVACRLLGFPSAQTVTDGGSFGEGDGPIWLSDVACSGNETSLLNCNSTKWNTSDCDHSQDVGVICNAPEPFPRVRLERRVNSYNENSPQNNYKLLEVYYDDKWGTVCDDYFYETDALVVCKELGYDEVISYTRVYLDLPSNDTIEEDRQKQPIWLDNVNCTGNETSIIHCNHSKWGEHDCDHSNDIGIVCGYKSCYDWLKAGYNKSGIYAIRVHYNTFRVYCDMETDGGGWEVFQRRYANGSNNVDFDRDIYWYNYGRFYNNDEEFWLGLNFLSQVTNKSREKYSVELRIDLEDFNGTTAYAQYDNFQVGDHYSHNGTLTLGSYSGTAGDSFSYHNGQPFTVRSYYTNQTSCADKYRGGWWFKESDDQCIDGYLNGPFSDPPAIVWPTWRGQTELAASEMKVRSRPI